MSVLSGGSAANAVGAGGVAVIGIMGVDPDGAVQADRKSNNQAQNSPSMDFILAPKNMSHPF